MCAALSHCTEASSFEVFQADLSGQGSLHNQSASGLRLLAAAAHLY